MSPRLSHILIALSGILGTILLGLYFGIGFSIGLAQLPPSVSRAQELSVATRYHNLWFLGTWLQERSFSGLISSHESLATWL